MKKPKIRFNGFNDDWEQRKLGDLVERITKKNQDLLSELPLTISAQYGLIDQKEFFDKRVASKDISGYYLIKNGEFAYNKSTSTDAPWGAIKRLDRYETGVLSTLYIVFGIKKDTELNSNFLTAYYSTNLWHKEIHEIAAEGARNHGLLNISPADFFKTKLSTPQDLKEQNKIGNYFIQLDQLITLHQRKCDEIKKLKKYMLQNMFPQDEEKVPKIRFYGFTDDWEQRKFVEFVKNAAKKNKDNIDLEPYAVTNDRGFIAQKDAHDDFGYMSNVDRTAYNIVPPNSFAYNPARINVGSLGYYEGTENVIVSSLYEVFQTEEYIDDKFLLHWFKSDSFPRWIEKLQEGSVRLYFYFDKLVQCQMMVPSLEEQKRISAYLDSIDQLITLHQCKSNFCKKNEVNAWEQRKVSEIADRFDNLRVPVAANLRTPGTTPYYGANGIQDYVEGYTHDGEFVLVAEDGANDLKNYPVKCVNGRIWVNNHAHVLQARPQIASNQFLAYSMSQANIEALLVGGGRAKLNAEVMMGIVLRIPRLQEQEVIGGYFYKLDQLITLHQRKCDELKNMKKFMLQNMFV